MAQAQRFSTQARRARAVARLGARAGGVGDVVERLVAVHATDPATVYLAVAARLADPDTAVAAVERELYAQPAALTRMLAMRRTMFVVRRAFAPEVYAAAGRRIAVKERKNLLAHLAEGGGWDAAWLDEVEAEVTAALVAHPESSGAELSRLVPRLREQIVVARGKPYEATQNVASRIIRTMAAEGRIERRRPAGSWTSGQFRWAKAEPLPEVPAEPARAALAKTWLGAYGPGTEADLKWWTGWTLGETRKALGAVGAQAVVLDDGATAYVLPGDAYPSEAPAGPPTVQLLPALDPAAMGWQDRAWFLPDSRDGLFDRTGNIGPTVWWDGEVIGAWAQRADGSVAWHRLADRGTAACAAVDEAAHALAALLGDVRVTPRFRTPLERALSA
ncbi:winged helix DNA-binding domain-containing protein [Actinacidiphila paucisporea]|uniref:Winged helix DNA-binding domain-containing protein n=1 Tax=Actinacidiphila paucisporea TaxID=310782 RepID=A0A1M7ESS8_9ACTN|nr:winged helix DNA-binding domain-containing protein [Actinacidiphila paucisporea]SHL94862.1 Winged helix DNA-binding domain-containing protein [Actinacidiphila paucisporea]